jgi:hypothetical protein
VSRIEPERRLFAARAALLARTAPPPFAAVLAEVRGEREARTKSARAIRRPLSFIAFAAAAAIAGIVFTRRDGATAVEVLPDPRSSVLCYDDAASLAVEAAAYATDRAIASAEDRYSACLLATPAGACAAAPIARDVTCDGLGPQSDAAFDEEARGGSLQ